MSLLDPLDFTALEPAERASPRTPIPTRFVSSDEFLPSPQTAKQREVESRLKELGTRLARQPGRDPAAVLRYGRRHGERVRRR